MTDTTDRILYYSHNLNPRVAVAVARHLDSPVRYVRADPMGKDKDWFRPINPNTRVPVLVENGRSLWETDAIAMRLSALAGGDFWPEDRREEVMMWVSWSGYHLIRAGDVFYFENIIVARYFDRDPDEQLLAGAGADFANHAKVLDDALAGRTWLVGDRPTYADFRAASVLPFASEAKLTLEGFDNIRRWHDRLMQIDAWRDPFSGLD